MKYPDAHAVAAAAYNSTDCKSHPQFCALTRGAISTRTFRRWLAGDGPMNAMARQYLTLMTTGWRPQR